MLYVTNAFSLNMMNLDIAKNVRFVPVPTENVKDILRGATEGIINAIGHPDTASLVAADINSEILPPAQRISVSMTVTDVLIIAQYIGPRLPEGSVKLPQGATIKYVQAYFV